MNKTKIIECDCKHEYQDARYGKRHRATTPNNSEQTKNNFVVRCTVCGKEHRLGVVK